MSVSLPFGQSARSASILVVDQKHDVADLFRKRFFAARQETYVMHCAASGVEALTRLAGRFSLHSSRSCPTSTCRAWKVWNYSGRSISVAPICRSSW
jgi:hypothetical protein